MNGRSARELRRVENFEASAPGWTEVRAALFGDRFKAGYGHNDPAYMPLYPHEAAEYTFSRGRVMWDRNHSCADLELYIERAPVIEQLQAPGKRQDNEQWYDDACRLAAKWILGRIRAVPDDAKLVTTFWPEMESIFPHVPNMNMSTAQQQWVMAAVFRIFDADRFDRRT